MPRRKKRRRSTNGFDLSSPRDLCGPLPRTAPDAADLYDRLRLNRIASDDAEAICAVYKESRRVPRPRLLEGAGGTGAR